jgi:hypothetical protein
MPHFNYSTGKSNKDTNVNISIHSEDERNALFAVIEKFFDVTVVRNENVKPATEETSVQEETYIPKVGDCVKAIESNSYGAFDSYCGQFGVVIDVDEGCTLNTMVQFGPHSLKYWGSSKYLKLLIRPD